MSKKTEISMLAAEANIPYTYYPKGTHPEKKSQTWEFREGQKLKAVFTCPDRSIGWLNEQIQKQQGQGSKKQDWEGPPYGWGYE